jgi:hypothetical protein
MKYFINLLVLAIVLFGFPTTSQAQSQDFDGLRISVHSIRAGQTGGFSEPISATLRLENATGRNGVPHQIAVAAVSGRGGWCGDREVSASLREGNGQQTDRSCISGLSFGKDEDDWLIIRPGGSVPVTIEFSLPQYNPVAPPFFITAELKLYHFDGRSAQKVPVFLGPIGTAPPRKQLYPQTR